MTMTTRKRQLKKIIFGDNLFVACCFCKKDLTIDTATLEHIIPKSKKGPLELYNLNISCGECNNKRGDMPYKKFKERFKGIK
jgi:5-methylcytosine-specific restriction endonuclease McrA